MGCAAASCNWLEAGRLQLRSTVLGQHPLLEWRLERVMRDDYSITHHPVQQDTMILYTVLSSANAAARAGVVVSRPVLVLGLCVTDVSLRHGINFGNH